MRTAIIMCALDINSRNGLAAVSYSFVAQCRFTRPVCFDIRIIFGNISSVSLYSCARDCGVSENDYNIIHGGGDKI